VHLVKKRLHTLSGTQKNKTNFRDVFVLTHSLLYYTIIPARKKEKGESFKKEIEAGLYPKPAPRKAIRGAAGIFIIKKQNLPESLPLSGDP